MCSAERQAWHAYDGSPSPESSFLKNLPPSRNDFANSHVHSPHLLRGNGPTLPWPHSPPTGDISHVRQRLASRSHDPVDRSSRAIHVPSATKPRGTRYPSNREHGPKTSTSCAPPKPPHFPPDTSAFTATSISRPAKTPGSSVEVQDSAAPYHDWNERITAECYAPNGASRILTTRTRSSASSTTIPG